MNSHPLPGKTLKALGELICGHGYMGISRDSETAHEFLASAGLQCGEICRNVIPTGWVEGKLAHYNQDSDQIAKAILHIVSWWHFLDRPQLFEPTLHRLQLILAPAGWTVEMDGITPYLRRMPPSFLLQKRTFLPMEQTPEFSKICADQAWVKVLRGRWDEAERCIAADAPVAAIVMLGSVLEGALKVVCNRFKTEATQAAPAPKDPKTGKTKQLPQWTFHDLIEVAKGLGWIGAEVGRLGHALRDYRNLVHLAEQVRSQEIPTQGAARTCREAVLSALRELIGYLDRQAQIQ